MSQPTGKPKVRIHEFVGAPGTGKYVSLEAYAELNEELDALKKESDEMRRYGALTDVQVEEMTRIRAEREQAVKRLNDLTVFMREHYATEIGLAQHANMKDSVDAAMFYMGRERIMSREAERIQRNEAMREAGRGR